MGRLSGLMGFSLLAALALPAQALTLSAVPQLLAQTASGGTPPESVPRGTQVRIDGAANLQVINQRLEQQFETRYAGTQVDLATNGSDQALQALLAGQIDLAAIGRPLTAAEKSQGLVAVPVSIEKLAIIVSPENPFSGSLTFEQFAQIFRGEITDWSEVGGEPGAIRLIDRPATSDTRRAFLLYPIFQNASFAVGRTAEPVSVDETRAVIEALGRDGVGFAIASQVLDNDAVKILPMHQTLPDDPRYPFSQVRSYVYKGDLSPAVQAYLGFATSAEGQAAVAEAKAIEAVEAAGGEGAHSQETPAVATATLPAEAPPTAERPSPSNSPEQPPAGRQKLPLWGWCLPLGLLGVLLGVRLRNRQNPLHEVVEPVPFEVDDTEPEPILAETVGAGPFIRAVPDDRLDGAVDLDLEDDSEGGQTVARHGQMPTASAIAPADRVAKRVNLTTEVTPPVALVIPAYAATRTRQGTSRSMPLNKATTDQNKDGNVNLPTTALVNSAVLSARAATVRAIRLADDAANGADAMSTARIIPPQESPMTDPIDEQSLVEATKYETGSDELDMAALASVDEGLADLPDGYGESRIVLMPRDPRWAYAYWDIPNSHREELRNQGGQQLALRLYDVTDIDLNHQVPHSLQQYDCDEMARTWYLPVPVSDRDYVLEIGYLALDDRWLVLARSETVHIPPVYPSDWIEDRFLGVNWDENLQGKTFAMLKRPGFEALDPGAHPIHDAIFAQLKSTDIMRVAGSLFGSMQQVPEQAMSSYLFPSGLGMWTLPTASGIPNVSGLTLSGIGFSASAPPIRPRKFWLVADAELIVYGATEPDATVTIGDRVIPLNPDGTFRFQMSFQDGVIDYPIVAVAADGEQTRSIHMTFERATPEQNTNTQAEARDEWFGGEPG